MDTSKIEHLVADCLHWMKKGSRTAAEAAGRYPEHYDELLDLLQTYETVRDSEKPAVRPDFRANARIRLQNRIAASQPAVTKKADVRPIWRSTNSKPFRRYSMSWLLLIGLAATLLAGGGGVAYASIDALPGDALYSVKNTLHDVELAFSNDANDVALMLEFMSQNVGEIEQLAAQERYGDIALGLQAYKENLAAMQQAQTRLSYDDPAAAESLNTRIQQKLQTCTQDLLQVQDQIRLQTQDQLHIQDKLQEAIQLSETGQTYGPNDGGKPEESGQPNGAGAGEPQGPQDDPAQTGQPEDTGAGSGSGP
ncbi:MAG TPA: DUF5667 domain-containing protein, partial [Anaerolineales bacterium]|nr:DUF5667 domain-containing protein [Anaerolineales bacterium]